MLEGFSRIFELENNLLSCSLSTAIIIFLEHFNALFKMVLLTVCPKNGKKCSSGPRTISTDTEGNNYFSICQNIEMKQEINFYFNLK